MKVSIVMSCSDRVQTLKNTLESWSRITWPDYEFILIDNASKDKKEVWELAQNIYARMRYFHFIRNESLVWVNNVWNRAAREYTHGEYVIFAMQDELLSDYDLLQKMIAYGDKRATVNTYFLGEKMKLPEGWLDNPKLIESIPGFWDFEDKGSTNRDKVDASLLSHIIGWTRERWDWFGWFRKNDVGHLWLDQDVVIRSRVLGIQSETVSSCYHQFHPTFIDPRWLAPGYHPVNERQARLLEESERDES